MCGDSMWSPLISPAWPNPCWGMGEAALDPHIPEGQWKNRAGGEVGLDWSRLSGAVPGPGPRKAGTAHPFECMELVLCKVGFIITPVAMGSEIGGGGVS